MAFISVIIPTFNRKKLLSRALQSVFNQTFKDYEILVIDDGSFDGTSELEILKDNNRLRYLRSDHNRGVSASRNEGIARSRGEWIAFLDSDDEWLPRKLEKQIKWAGAHPEIEIFQTREIWIRNGVRVNPPITHEKVGGDLFRQSLDRCMITPSSVMIRKELLNKVGGFNESFQACEDYDLWLRIAKSHQVGLINEYLLIRYGGHDDQLSSTVPALDRFRIRSLLGLIQTGGLTGEQEKLVISTLIHKSRIVAQGFLKRGNQELYERYKCIADKYS